jgi:UPF0176 protein
MEQLAEEACTTYPFLVTAFYHFAPLTKSQLESIEEDLYSLAKQNNVYGLIISATEGLNGTISGSDRGIAALKNMILILPGFSSTVFKDSRAKENPFKRFKIKRRPEIVTLKRPEYVPETPVNNHLSPTEWHRVMQEEDVVIIDTRNGYEYDIGKFKGAIDPEIHKFSEFKTYLDQSDIPKNKKVLIYCTGGIRCEKAIIDMQERGYDNVYQLEGGILNYLKEFPNSEFEGECFVFDNRIAVDQELLPTKTYGLCPHCGDPGKTRATCPECSNTAIVCDACLCLPHGSACSKNCSHHFRRKNKNL